MPYAERAAEAEEWATQHGVRPARERRAPDLPRRRGRPEHVLHARVRAVRPGRARRQPPPVRVRLPQPRRDHAGRADDRHAPRRADLPPGVARRRGRPPPRAVHAGLGRRRRARRLAGGGPGAPGAPAPLRPRARAGRPLPADGLAVPRDARRDRPRARLGGRGGDLLPRDRAQEPARLPDQGRRPADRALLRARAGGRRPAKRGVGRPPALVRRGRDRRPGEEPLRRLDDRRSARRPRRARRAGLPARGLHLTGRRPGRRSTTRRRRTPGRSRALHTRCSTERPHRPGSAEPMPDPERGF